MKYFKLIFLASTSILSSTTFLVAQTKAKSTNYQLQKGRFLISTNTISFSPAKTETRNYQNNLLLSSIKRNPVGLNFLFRSGNWGSGGFVNLNVEQFDAGNNPTSSSKEKQGNIFLNPTAGYFVRERLMVGVELLIQTGKYKYNSSSIGGNNSGDNKEHLLGIGPELRYYFGKPGSKRFPFAGVSSLLFTNGGTRNQNTTTFTNNSSSKGNGGSVTPYAGYSWLIGKRWLIEPAVMGNFNTSYSESKVTYTGGGNTTVTNYSSKFKSTSVAGIRLNVSFTL